MKRNSIMLLFIFGIMVFTTASYGQDVPLLADQNPRFAESVNKYGKIADSLIKTQGTTVQQTYKAYDWYEAREERRSLRRQRNYDYSLSVGYNYGNSWYYSHYRRPGSLYAPFGYGHGNWWLGW